MKKTILSFLAMLLFFSSLNIYVSAANDGLTHEDMIRLYGKDYENAFLKTTVDASTKLTLRQETNREMIESHVNNITDFYKNLNDFERGDFKQFFINASAGAIALKDTFKEYLAKLFSDAEIVNDYTPSISCDKNSYTSRTETWGWQFFVEADCGLKIQNKSSGKTYQWIAFRENYHLDNHKFSNTYDGIYLKELIPQPYSLYLADTYIQKHLNSYIVYNNVPIYPDYPTLSTGRQNMINNIPTIPDTIYIPPLKPEANCPNGLIAITPDGVGGYLNSQGDPIDVSQCTVIWKVPDVDIDDKGNVVIDNINVVDGETGDSDNGGNSGDTNIDGSNCDGVLCFLSTILKAIGKLVIAIVDLGKDIVKAIGSLALKIVDGILEGLKEVLKFLFVPDENFWNENLNKLKALMFEDEINEIISAVESMQGVAAPQTFGVASLDDSPAVGSRNISGTFQDVAIKIMGIDAVIVDADIVNSALDKLHSWVRGFFYALLVLYNVNQIYKLIRGTTIYEGMGVKVTGGKANDN